MKEYINSPFVIGLTGGIGAGKSAIIKHLTKSLERDFLFDCDLEVHALYRNPIMIEWLKDKFGPIGDNARAHMAQKVAGNPHVLSILERMFTPCLIHQLDQFIADSYEHDFVIVDAPLLFESRMDEKCHATITVACPEEIRRERVMMRPGMTEAKLNIMLSRQYTDDARAKRADYVIDASKSLEETFSQIDAVMSVIKEKINGN